MHVNTQGIIHLIRYPCPAQYFPKDKLENVLINVILKTIHWAIVDVRFSNDGQTNHRHFIWLVISPYTIFHNFMLISNAFKVYLNL